MDPVSIIGLTAAIQQILTAIYKFGHGVREAKREINLLCSELLAFRAALDHVQLNLQHDEKIQLDYVQGAQKELATSNLFIPEFHEMIQSAQALLSELFTRLEKSDRLQLMLRRLTWPLKKDDVNTFITHLERLKTFFIMATTTDNR